MMNNASTRTAIFVGVAAACAGMAYLTHRATLPAAVEGFERVGEPFYPDFADPNQATALRVAAWDATSGSSSVFSVELRDGRWRIPSHHNYPAEGQQRLAQTAASTLGIVREAVASRRESDHERLGVVDPLSDDAGPRGRGQRVTLFRGDEVLADYILGEEIEGRPGHRYLRRPDEKETYLAKVEIRLTTKFSDWIEPDLLKLERDDLVELVIDRYSIDELRGAIVGSEVTRLSRKSFRDPWEMDGLDDAVEEVDEDRLRDMTRDLDDLKIVGVRPKPRGIGADLRLDLPESITSDPRRLRAVQQALQQDLAEQGFFIARDESDNFRLVSKEGQLTAATLEGVVYHLYFGRAFEGTTEEIEIGTDGGAASSDANGEGDDAPAANGERETPGDAANDDANGGTGEGTLSRYLFLRVEFDPQHVGEEPVRPSEPVKPEALEEAPDAESNAEPADDGGAEPAEGNGAAADGDGADPNDAEASQAAETAADEEAPADDPQAQYEAALKQYEEDLAQYESDLADYQEKLQKGREKADELNDRFAQWYYVISGESFRNLRLARSELLKSKTQDEAGDGEDDSGPVEAPNPPADL